MRATWCPTCPICGGSHHPIFINGALACPNEERSTDKSVSEPVRRVDEDGVIIEGPEA
jgi:hypothetical protein